MAAPKIIAETEHSVAIFAAGDSDYLLTTYSSMKVLASGVRFWGQQLSLKHDISTLSIVARSPHWYPNEDTQRILDRSLKEMGYSGPIVSYGYSMGAYAAIRFSNHIGSAATIAFSPQWSISPADVPTDTRFQAYFDPVKNCGMRIEADHIAPNSIVIFDQMVAQDRLNVDHIARAGLDKIQLIPMRFSGHGTIQLARNGQVAKAMFASALRGDANGIRELLRSRRRTTSSYYDGVARSLRARKNITAARAVLEYGIRKIPNSLDLQIRLAQLEFAHDDERAAIRKMRRLCDDFPRNARIHRVLAQMFDALDCAGLATRHRGMAAMLAPHRTAWRIGLGSE